jgi:hypothetical protein
MESAENIIMIPTNIANKVKNLDFSFIFIHPWPALQNSTLKISMANQVFKDSVVIFRGLGSFDKGKFLIVRTEDDDPNQKFG